MILEKYKGKIIDVYDCQNEKALKCVLVDVDATGVLCYNMGGDTTFYIPYSSKFFFAIDGKPEDRKDEDWN